MLYPEYIKYGDVIAVTAPSDGNSEELDYIRLERARNQIVSRGFEVIETPDVRTSNKGRSAEASVRAFEFHEVWSNALVKAVISAKGGDFLMEMLSYIDFEQLRNTPKWFQGFSDNTGLTFLITTLCDIATIYSNNFNDFAMSVWHDSLENNINILQGNIVCQNAFDMYQDGFFKGVDGSEGYELTKSVSWECITGKEDVCFEGRLLGGCFDVLLNLVGTRYDKVVDFNRKYADDGIVWFLESFSLDGCAVERGLWQLGEAGWFDNAKGFVFGRPAFYSLDEYPVYSEAVMSQLKRYNVPVIINADIGHKPPQFTMVNGAVCKVTYKADCKSVQLKMI